MKLTVECVFLALVRGRKRDEGRASRREPSHSRQTIKHEKCWPHSPLPSPLDMALEENISSFARLKGFVIRRRANWFRLFLGSSAVEHSTVNRMVAGSNPARGAKETQ